MGDEIPMPKRPNVQPAITDCEVWVDPLPDDDVVHDWHAAFGEIDEIYRLSNESTGELGHVGYVRFIEPEAAALCVDSGSGIWSESERVLKSDVKTHSKEERALKSAYPKTVIGLLLGRGGEALTKVKREVG